MTEKLTKNKIMKALDWAYDKAINGVPGLDSAQEMAESYLSGEGSIRDKANALIRWQNVKAGTTGFVTGLGGLLTMPVTIPADISVVIYIQVRMIAAIAHMGGHDIRDDKVKTLVYVCLTGNAAKDLLKNVGIVVGTKLTEQAIKKISGRTLIEINKRVGFRLLAKFGEKGAINFVKFIPVVSGIVGATFDSVATNIIGNVAKDMFISEE